MLKFTTEEVRKFLLTLVSTALGFFLALWVNSMVEHSKEHKAYRSIVRSFQTESDGNKDVLLHSIVPNLGPDRIIYRNFSVSSVENALGNPIFLANVSDADVRTLNEYILYLKRTNLFIAADTKYKYDSSLQKWRRTIDERLWQEMIALDSQNIRKGSELDRK